MAEAHQIERAGLDSLTLHLTTQCRTVGKSKDKSYDLLVDGHPAEVKTKGKNWAGFDFISLTSKQVDLIRDGTITKIFIVLDAGSDTPEHIEIEAIQLLSCDYNEITHFEWNKGSIAHLRK